MIINNMVNNNILIGTIISASIFNIVLSLYSKSKVSNKSINVSVPVSDKFTQYDIEDANTTDNNQNATDYYFEDAFYEEINHNDRKSVKDQDFKRLFSSL